MARKSQSNKTTEDGTPVALEQFPALSGAEQVEIAKRSQDVHVEATDTHRKGFVVTKQSWTENSDEGNAVRHERNITATRQYLMQQGLRPVEDGRFVEAEDHQDGLSVILWYEVKVRAAVVADGEEEPEVAHAHVHADEQANTPEVALPEDDPRKPSEAERV